MRVQETRRRSRYVLLVLTLVAVTLITLDSRGVGVFDGVRNVASDVFSPVQGVTDWISSPFRNAWNGATGYDDLEEENRRLRDELTEMRSQQARNANAESELRALREELGEQPVGNLENVLARVTTGPFSNFEDYRLQIDKGSDDGLASGMPVVAGGSLVGRLDRVSRTRSVVQLASDPDFVIGVRLASNQDTGVGHGGGSSGQFIVDKRIELSGNVKPGEVVVTSGLDGLSVMPPDIPIGRVTEVTPDEAAQGLILQVEFGADFSVLDVVRVLKWTPPS